MFMAGVLFMLGVIAAGAAVRLALAFWQTILGILFLLAAGLAAIIAPGQVVPVLVGLPVLALLIFLPIAMGDRQDAKRLEAKLQARTASRLEGERTREKRLKDPRWRDPVWRAQEIQRIMDA